MPDEAQTPMAETRKNPDSRCKTLTKAGKPCRAAATEGGLCFFHANPSKASELGRIGGRRKRGATSENLDPLPVLDTAAAVRDTGARLIADIYTGKVHPRMVAGLAPLLNLQLRAIESTNIEQRLSELEKWAAKTKELQAEEELEDKSRAPHGNGWAR